MSENWYCTGCGSTSYPWHHPFCTGPRPVVPAAPSGEPNDPDTLAGGERREYGVLDALEDAAKIAEREHAMGTSGVGIAEAIRRFARHPVFRSSRPPAAAGGERPDHWWRQAVIDNARAHGLDAIGFFSEVCGRLHVLSSRPPAAAAPTTEG